MYTAGIPVPGRVRHRIPTPGPGPGDRSRYRFVLVNSQHAARPSHGCTFAGPLEQAEGASVSTRPSVAETCRLHTSRISSSASRSFPSWHSRLMSWPTQHSFQRYCFTQHTSPSWIALRVSRPCTHLRLQNAQATSKIFAWLSSMICNALQLSQLH